MRPYPPSSMTAPMECGPIVKLDLGEIWCIRHSTSPALHLCHTHETESQRNAFLIKRPTFSSPSPSSSPPPSSFPMSPSLTSSHSNPSSNMTSLSPSYPTTFPQISSHHQTTLTSFISNPHPTQETLQTLTLTIQTLAKLASQSHLPDSVAMTTKSALTKLATTTFTTTTAPHNNPLILTEQIIQNLVQAGQNGNYNDVASFTIATTIWKTLMTLVLPSKDLVQMNIVARGVAREFIGVLDWREGLRKIKEKVALFLGKALKRLLGMMYNEGVGIRIESSVEVVLGGARALAEGWKGVEGDCGGVSEEVVKVVLDSLEVVLGASEVKLILIAARQSMESNALPVMKAGFCLLTVYLMRLAISYVERESSGTQNGKESDLKTQDDTKASGMRAIAKRDVLHYLLQSVFNSFDEAAYYTFTTNDKEPNLYRLSVTCTTDLLLTTSQYKETAKRLSHKEFLLQQLLSTSSLRAALAADVLFNLFSAYNVNGRRRFLQNIFKLTRIAIASDSLAAPLRLLPLATRFACLLYDNQQLTSADLFEYDSSSKRPHFCDEASLKVLLRLLRIYAKNPQDAKQVLTNLNTNILLLTQFVSSAICTTSYGDRIAAACLSLAPFLLAPTTMHATIQTIMQRPRSSPSININSLDALSLTELPPPLLHQITTQISQQYHQSGAWVYPAITRFVSNATKCLQTSGAWNSWPLLSQVLENVFRDFDKVAREFPVIALGVLSHGIGIYRNIKEYGQQKGPGGAVVQMLPCTKQVIEGGWARMSAVEKDPRSLESILLSSIQVQKPPGSVAAVAKNNSLEVSAEEIIKLRKVCVQTIKKCSTVERGEANPRLVLEVEQLKKSMAALFMVLDEKQSIRNKR